MLIATGIFAGTTEKGNTSKSDKWTPFEFGTLDLINPDEPIQLFGSDVNVYGMRLSILFANNKNIKGIDFGVFGLSRVDENMSGIQLGAGGNSVENSFKGLQLAGIANYAEHVGDIQIAGIGNGTQELKGVQISAINIIANKQTLPVLPIVNASF